jgi:hypothetical protein
MRAIVLLLLAACASSPRAGVPESPPAIPETRVTPAPAVNPVGAFEWASALPDGTPIKGTVAISGSPGAYTGSITADGLGIFPIKTVVVTGQTMVVNADHPDGNLELRLTFGGDEFLGSWHLGDSTGQMTGKRRP